MELAILDPLPLLRLGAIAALGGGTELCSADELTTWVATGRPCVLLMSLNQENDEGWAILASLRGHPAVRPVALLSPFTVALAARALRAGAVHVMARESDAAVLRRIVDEVEQGVLRLSVDLLRAATALPRTGHGGVPPSDEELAWLRALAEGSTIALVAQDVGISERVLYRRLGQLYRRLGVPGRTQALILGRDEGWW